MKKIAVILNTNQLGGAERSLVEQMALLAEKCELHFFIPDVGGGAEKLEALLQSKKLHRISTFYYPKFLYQRSRQSRGNLHTLILNLPVLLLAVIKWKATFSDFNSFYLNGIKASLPVFSWMYLFRFGGEVFWHFRDYPSEKAFSKLSPLFLRLKPTGLSVTFIANSYSVAGELKRFFPSERIQTIYNLTGPIPIKDRVKEVRTIGVVSMAAPWKGIHEVILMAALFENELRSLGIERINYYGDAIYKTTGDHNDYVAQLYSLKDKLRADLFSFEGIQSPEKIFSEIQLLIHSSLTPEPFGRVIAEAFKSGIPVISTGLGGSGELVVDGESGYTYDRHSSGELFNKIKVSLKNEVQKGLILVTAANRVKDVEIEAQIKISELLIS